MKKIRILIIVLIMALSASPCFGAAASESIYPDSQYDDMIHYLIINGIYDDPVRVQKQDTQVYRWMGVEYVAKFMMKTDPNWKITSNHPFKDIKSSKAEFHTWVATVNNNGVMKGSGSNINGQYFAPDLEMTLQEYITVLLRAMGYGYNDSIQEFNWDSVFDTAVGVGLVTKDELAMLKKHNYFMYSDMLFLTYKATKMCANNPYNPKYLEELIQNNPPSEEVVDFINKSKAVKSGFQKIQFTYFTLYYQDTAQARACLDLIKPHADKVYAMLQDLYGIQPTFDVYLVENDVQREPVKVSQGVYKGIYKNDTMTYLWLEEGNDADGNNLGELIREMNNVFYDNIAGLSKNRIVYTSETLPWKVRANMNLIGSMYTKYNYSGKVDQASMFELPSMRMNLRDADKYGMSQNNKNKLYELYYYAKLFSLKGPSEFRGGLRNLGSETAMTPPSMPTSMLELDKSFVQ